MDNLLAGLGVRAVMLPHRGLFLTSFRDSSSFSEPMLPKRVLFKIIQKAVLTKL
jgi:hypothetical protein